MHSLSRCPAFFLYPTENSKRFPRVVVLLYCRPLYGVHHASFQHLTEQTLPHNVVFPEQHSLSEQVPKVTFMDLFVYPTSTLAISKRGQKDVEISALDTEIHGSHHVESLDCNNRFELLLNVRLASEEDTYDASFS